MRSRLATDQGAVTVFVAIAAVGLLALVGLVVDGGGKVRAIQRADRVAAEAARAGGQAVDLTSAMAGDGIRVDRRAAVAAAQRYLGASGMQGEVHVSPDGTSLSVNTSTSESTVFLAVIGIGRISASGTANVSLIHQERG